MVEVQKKEDAPISVPSVASSLPINPPTKVSPVVVTPPIVSVPSPNPSIKNPVPSYQNSPNSSENNSRKKLWWGIVGAAVLILILLFGGYFVVKTISSSSNSSSEGNFSSPSASQGEGKADILDSNSMDENSSFGFVDSDSGAEVPAVNGSVPSLEDLFNEANGTGEGVLDKEANFSTNSGRILSIPSAGDGTQVLIRGLACAVSTIHLNVETISGSPAQILFLIGDGVILQDYTKNKSSTPIESFSFDISNLPLNLPNTTVELGFFDLSGDYISLDLWGCHI